MLYCSETAESKSTIVASEVSKSPSFLCGSVQSKDSDYDFKDRKLKVNEVSTKRYT